MSGIQNGEHMKIESVYRNAIYVHYCSHVLNMALSICCSSVPPIRNLFDNVAKITWFLRGSAKRKAILLQVTMKTISLTQKMA